LTLRHIHIKMTCSIIVRPIGTGPVVPPRRIRVSPYSQSNLSG